MTPSNVSLGDQGHGQSRAEAWRRQLIHAAPIARSCRVARRSVGTARHCGTGMRLPQHRGAIFATTRVDDDIEGGLSDARNACMPGIKPIHIRRQTFVCVEDREPDDFVVGNTVGEGRAVGGSDRAARRRRAGSSDLGHDGADERGPEIARAVRTRSCQQGRWVSAATGPLLPRLSRQPVALPVHGRPPRRRIPSMGGRSASGHRRARRCAWDGRGSVAPTP
jgi:hypothetical protein